MDAERLLGEADRRWQALLAERPDLGPAVDLQRRLVSRVNLTLPNTGTAWAAGAHSIIVRSILSCCAFVMVGPLSHEHGFFGNGSGARSGRRVWTDATCDSMYAIASLTRCIRSAIVVRNLDTEHRLKGHQQLDLIKRIGPKIVAEERLVGDGVMIDTEMLHDEAPYLASDRYVASRRRQEPAT